MKHMLGFFTGGCLMMILSATLTIAFWGSLIYVIIHILKTQGIL